MDIEKNNFEIEQKNPSSEILLGRQMENQQVGESLDVLSSYVFQITNLKKIQPFDLEK